ncbi:MAG: GTP cyclohydrolase I, partial [Anaerolineales bacterium]|nr:GTP cyclohydrolase I [Anaerolineales bacterium]
MREFTKVNGYANGYTNGHGKTNGHNGYHQEAVGKAPEKVAIEEAVRAILHNVGEDPERDGLIGTPDRIARMYDEVLGGYHVDPEKLVNGALFDVDYSEMVLVKDIEYFSMCEHHMLP